MIRALAALFLFAFAGCASFAPQPACLLPSQKPMIEAQLFFGRDIPGRGPVSDSEWSDFAAGVATKEFPDGFTASDGEGQWRDPGSQKIIREQSRILLVVAPASPDFADRLHRIMEAYRARFHQQSVGLVTHDVCAAF